MNVGIGTVAAQFLFREYLFRIFGIVFLQCTPGIFVSNFRHCVFAVYPGDAHMPPDKFSCTQNTVDRPFCAECNPCKVSVGLY
jgi:hypothetical protein